MSASFTGYGTIATLYGGVSRNDNGDVGACYSPATSAPCYFHQSVWMFLPGNKVAAVGSITGANWVHIGDAGAYGGPPPAGRMEHIAGAIGDQLYVYGGTTATGPTQVSPHGGGTGC